MISGKKVNDEPVSCNRYIAVWILKSVWYEFKFQPVKRLTFILGGIMKQKYSIHKDTEKQTLVIKEYGELNKEILSLLCEEAYPEAVIQDAIKEGKEALIKVLRTRNMYPPGVFANSIADLVITFYGSDGEQSTEIMLDDKEFFEKNGIDVPQEEEVVESDENDIDSVLDDNIDEVYEEKKIIKDLKSTIKVADEDGNDTDGDM